MMCPVHESACSCKQNKNDLIRNHIPYGKSLWKCCTYRHGLQLTFIFYMRSIKCIMHIQLMYLALYTKQTY